MTVVRPWLARAPISTQLVCHRFHKAHAARNRSKKIAKNLMFKTTPHSILEQLEKSPSSQGLWEELVEYYAAPLFRHVKSDYRLSDFDCEEVVADTLAYLFQKLRTQQFETQRTRDRAFRSYLKNAAMFALSQKKRAAAKVESYEPDAVVEILHTCIETQQQHQLESTAFDELEEKFNNDYRWEIFKAVKSGTRRAEVSAQFGVSVSTIFRIVNEIQCICTEYMEQKVDECA